jgi:hypothetical protein
MQPCALHQGVLARHPPVSFFLLTSSCEGSAISAQGRGVGGIVL